MCRNHAAPAAQSGGAFAEHLAGVLNSASAALMISLGHRTGLFDAMDGTPPSTSAEIAQRTNLSERYVREWLSAMTLAGVVEFDPRGGRFHLPGEHADVLTRRAAPSNMAASMQWIAVLGGAESAVAEAFRHGRGVPYSAYGRFHEVMAEESGQTVLGGLHEHIVPLVQGLRERLESGVRVLDVGCGAGLAMIELARRYPRSTFHGVDACDEAVTIGLRRAADLGVRNIDLRVGDAATHGEPAAMDVVTAFDAIHDQARPAAVLANIRRVLRPGGTFLMQDIRARSLLKDNLDHPLGTFLYTISCMHCMSVSLAGGGPGLGSAWGREVALSMLADAGFGDVKVHELPHDAINDYYVCAA